MYSFWALICWVIGFTFAIFRHWNVKNIERLGNNKQKQNFIRYFFNDIGDTSIIFIALLLEEYPNEEQNKLRLRVNVLTIISYILIGVAIVLYIIVKLF